jgi:hypothetical protein
VKTFLDDPQAPFVRAFREAFIVVWAAKTLAAEDVVRAMRQPQFEAGLDVERGARHLTAARSDDAEQPCAKSVLGLRTRAVDQENGKTSAIRILTPQLVNLRPDLLPLCAIWPRRA